MQTEALAASCLLLSCAHSHGNLGLSFPSSAQVGFRDMIFLGLVSPLQFSLQFSSLAQESLELSNASLSLHLAFLLLRSLSCGQDEAYYPLLRALVKALAFPWPENHPVLSGGSKCRCKLHSFHPLSQLFTQEFIFDAK